MGNEHIRIRPLGEFSAADLNRLNGPSTCQDTYRVVYQANESGAVFELQLTPLETPYIHCYDYIDDDWVKTWLKPAGFSFGAYDSEQLVGVLIAEQRDWNHSLWVWEFMVAAERRRQGIGRRLMEHAASQARAVGLRTIVCETQNRNSNAIKVYLKLGFQMEGVDISYYTNEDYPDGDVAVFMKLRLG
jgi:ribosomal protein S18 acetylase RimI-like enzyme